MKYCFINGKGAPYFEKFPEKGDLLVPWGDVEFFNKCDLFSALQAGGGEFLCAVKDSFWYGVKDNGTSVRKKIVVSVTPVADELDNFSRHIAYMMALLCGATESTLHFLALNRDDLREKCLQEVAQNEDRNLAKEAVFFAALPDVKMQPHKRLLNTVISAGGYFGKQACKIKEAEIRGGQSSALVDWGHIFSTPRDYFLKTVTDNFVKNMPI